MMIETELAKREIVLCQEGGYLVVDIDTGECEEVFEINSKLQCDCFIAKVSPDSLCGHITAVNSFMVGGDDPKVFSQSDADYYLSRIRVLDSEIEDNQNSAEIQHQHIDFWLGKETNHLEKKRSYFLQVLEEWARTNGFTTKNLVNGKLSLRKQPINIEILDIEKVLANEEFRRLIPEQITVDKKALRQHILATGEEPEGVKVAQVRSKFSYKLNERAGS